MVDESDFESYEYTIPRLSRRQINPLNPTLTLTSKTHTATLAPTTPIPTPTPPTPTSFSPSLNVHSISSCAFQKGSFCPFLLIGSCLCGVGGERTVLGRWRVRREREGEEGVWRWRWRLPEVRRMAAGRVEIFYGVETTW